MSGLRARAEEYLAMRRALLTMVQNVRIHLWRLRGQTTLALAAASTKDRGARLGEVARAARRIESERAPWATPFARMLHAGIAGLLCVAEFEISKVEILSADRSTQRW